MKISNVAKIAIIPFIIGNEQPWRPRTGRELVILFNSFGFRDDVYADGLPKLNNSNLKTSKKQYVQDRLLKIQDEKQFKIIIENLISESDNKDFAAQLINSEVTPDQCSVVLLNGEYVLVGIDSSASFDITNAVTFKGIQDDIIASLDNAKVSVIVAMAWFTNEVLLHKLLEKQAEGIDVELVIYNDGVNAAHGVDLSNLKHTKIRGTRGGLMHDKFCVIDNQIFITGSYNWSTNAECRNDENIIIAKDPDTATKYSIEFRRLKSKGKI